LTALVETYTFRNGEPFRQMKRFILFFATNILVVLTISVVLRVLGVGHYLSSQGIDYQSLAVFCLVWGMVGSLISLMLSKTMAKWSLGVQVVQKSDPRLGALVTMVDRLASKAGIPCPEVGVYESPEVNAFATGPSKRNALVAFSTGLLNAMDTDEIEGVAAHEVAHIQNGDMVTMALLQGIVNAFVMFLARALGWAAAQAMSGNRNQDDDSPAPSYLLSSVFTFVFELVFMMLGMLIVSGFSRWREFRADAGAARTAGKEKMIAALERLADRTRLVDDAPSLAAMKISGGVGRFFATHPPLESRIRALQQGRF
jgi:heat shock protein HtpX